MSKWRAWLAGVMVGVVLAGCVVVWMTTPRHAITLDTIRQVRPGQTLAEVEHLLGAPAGDYRLRGRALFYGMYDDGQHPKHLGGREWVADECGVIVLLDADRFVRQSFVGVAAGGQSIEPTPFLRRLLRGLGL